MPHKRLLREGLRATQLARAKSHSRGRQQPDRLCRVRAAGNKARKTSTVRKGDNVCCTQSPNSLLKLAKSWMAGNGVNQDFKGL